MNTLNISRRLAKRKPMAASGKFTDPLNETRASASSEPIKPLTRAQKAAATRARNAQLELEAQRKRYEEEARARAALDASQHAEDQQYWLHNREALLLLGRGAPLRSGRRTFGNTGCIALLSALAALGDKTRDEILHIMRHDYRYSYRHAGFLLSSLRGPNPEQHLWDVDAERHYHLHETKPLDRAQTHHS